MRAAGFAALALLGVGVACANGRLPPLAANDPRNPSAPEPPPPASVADVVPPAPSASPSMYRCPMHPEVTSAVPGTCPKCGMTLVPVPVAK